MNFHKLFSVIVSIVNQTVAPELVIIATSKVNIDKCQSNNFCGLQIVFIDSDGLGNNERSFLRNAILSEMKSCGKDYVLFLDGDTILAPKVIEITRNILLSEDNPVISIPRMDFDISVKSKNVGYITKVFLDAAEYPQFFGGFSYFNQYKKTPVSSISQCAFLPSYALVVSVKALMSIGLWDENFKGWGEEDIDFTFRLYKKGYDLMTPRIEGFITLHLTHEIDSTQHKNFIQNASYLLSKHPDIYEHRKHFYTLLGL